MYERHPFRPLRRLGLRAAERWVVKRQEADGGWGGIQPPWVYSLMALDLQGYPLDHPVMRAGLEGLDAFTVQESEQRWLEACQSPVWDTALALIALADAGLEPGDPALVRPAHWLLDRQVTDVAGDWAVRRPQLPSRRLGVRVRATSTTPTSTTRPMVVLALRRAGHPDSERGRVRQSGSPSSG